MNGVFLIHRKKDGDVGCFFDCATECSVTIDYYGDEEGKEYLRSLVGEDELLYVINFNPDDKAHQLLVAILLSGSPDGNYGLVDALEKLFLCCYQNGIKDGQKKTD